ncbi:uncharacterized protein LOC133194823 [Saccostrea echinata]|uniref:uncharacterized protein LOC133194823 n=1 Tax=Saccostrea echinata TaxID=191078 RepID=UPI002A810C30|nr:uncharacterized protein LOC133194823 [Saccostrea echinata]
MKGKLNSGLRIITMEYRFGNCIHHNKCLFNELNIQIGFEESIQMRRNVKEFEVRRKDSLSIFHPYLETICTGSVAEGFRHGRTDRDYMKVLKDINIIYSNLEILYSRGGDNSDKKLTLVISHESNYAKEGYVLLKFQNSGEDTFEEHAQCIQSALVGTYVSSHGFKKWWIKRTKDPNTNFFIHGPCISVTGVSSDHDMAFSLECPFWPPQAKEWVNRPRLWPSKQIVREIELDGCHLVPLGPVKDVENDLLWRLSFNKAEKKLMFAFNQTQFLCYGLFKIVLKECIEKIDTYPENSLCSYFIKTLMFWVIEETAPELWRPHNIVVCFLMCMLRLTHWIKIERCPNFFIPERNMFKSKVYGQTKMQLIETLKNVFNMGLWNCFAKCEKRIHIMTHHKDTTISCLKPYFVDQSYLREFRVLSSSFLTDDLCQFSKMENPNLENLSELETEFVTCQRLSLFQREALKALTPEKQVDYFTRAKELDLTRGPLMLATCLYGVKKYSQVIQIIQQINTRLKKFTFYAGINNAEVAKLHEVLPEYAFSPTVQRSSLREKREGLLAMDIIIRKEIIWTERDVFTKRPNRENTPSELQFDILFQRTSLVIHPLVYLHFLNFLCQKHLDQNNYAKKALTDLEDVVFEVCTHDDLPMAHLILGISYEKERRFEEALYHYKESYGRRSSYTSAICRAYLIQEYAQLCCPKFEPFLD